jgi:hypothetical protein
VGACAPTRRLSATLAPYNMKSLIIKTLIGFILLTQFSCWSLFTIPGCLQPIDNITNKDDNYLKAEKTALNYYKAILDSQYIKSFNMTKIDTALDKSYEDYIKYADNLRCILITSNNLKLHCYLSKYELSDNEGKNWKTFEHYNFFYTYKSKCGCQKNNHYKKIRSISIPKGDTLITKVDNIIQFYCP